MALLLCVSTTAAVSAHPLGNFTINHLSILHATAQRLDVRYVLDEAEIPSFAAMRDQSNSGRFTTAQLARWAKDQARLTVQQLELTIDGTQLPLMVDRSDAHMFPGAGGLPTLYLDLRLHATGSFGAHGFKYADHTFPNRLGWKDVVLAPATEPTQALRVYPSALIGSPRDITMVSTAKASTTSRTFAAASFPIQASSQNAVSAARSNQLSDLLARGTSDRRIVFITFLVAVGLGALHALEPGHGKTLLAVSLVGARATSKQALILAASLTFAHTIGVILLGVVILIGARYIVPETIYPWITLLSGACIAVLGARALARYVEKHRAVTHVHIHTHDHTHPHAHEHQHDHHGHPHSHHHDLDDEAHARMHAQAFEGPLSFRGVVIAAMSGGVAPCPAALVVLLTAVSLHQIAYGLAVILAFSMGLAGLLTGLGIAVVRGAGWLSSRPEFDRATKLGPLVSALVIAVIGAVMLGQGFAENGVNAPWLLISFLTLCAIAGFALFPHTHATSTPHRHEPELA